MAELPEVETYVREMQRAIVGRTITGGDVIVSQTVRFTTPEEFLREAAGAHIERLSRLGQVDAAHAQRQPCAGAASDALWLATPCVPE